MEATSGMEEHQQEQKHQQEHDVAAEEGSEAASEEWETLETLPPAQPAVALVATKPPQGEEAQQATVEEFLRSAQSKLEELLLSAAEAKAVQAQQQAAQIAQQEARDALHGQATESLCAKLNQADALLQELREKVALVDAAPKPVVEELRAVIALRAPNGQFLGLTNDVSCHRLEAKSTELTVLEKFKVWQLPSGKIALQCVGVPGGPFLMATPEGTLVARARTPRDWEEFEVEQMEGGKVALLGHHGKYVRAMWAGGAEVDCAGHSPRWWESLEWVAL